VPIGSPVDLVIGTDVLVAVPDVVGKPEKQALEMLKAAKLSIGERTTKPAPNQVGLVLAQSPKAGSEVAIGSSVDLVIGTAELVGVPDVVGKPETQAVEMLKAARLSIGERTTRPAPNQVGLVLAQTPKGGAQVPVGTAIDLTIGVARLVTVPNVIGLKVEAARETIARAGLAFGVARERESDRPGLVLEQDREGGKELPAGTLVNVVVGRAR
jgi:serine/threonine-protein kinase